MENKYNLPLQVWTNVLQTLEIPSDLWNPLVWTNVRSWLCINDQCALTENGGVNLWEQFSDTLKSKKAELAQESSWDKASTGKSPWSYRSMRGTALGPTMAFLRSQKKIWEEVEVAYFVHEMKLQLHILFILSYINMLHSLNFAKFSITKRINYVLTFSVMKLSGKVCSVKMEFLMHPLSTVS